MKRHMVCAAAGLAIAAIASATAPGTAATDPTAPLYKSERVIQSGDAAGSVAIPPGYSLFVGGLSDTGQIVFSAGMLDRSRPELLIQYAGGQFTPIVMPESGPVGAWPGDVYWPKDVTVARPLSMNKSGNVVFAVDHTYDFSPWATFMWNAATGHTVPVALKGMPATGDLSFTYPGGYAPAINSSNETALVGLVKDAKGVSGYGLFRLGRNGVLAPVARPHEALPDGSRISLDAFAMPSIDDAGRVAFLAHPDGSPTLSAYLRESDTVTPILTAGARAADGSTITAIRGVFLNSTNSIALVMAATDLADSGRYGLFRVQNGQATGVALPGQTMPGGGKLKTVQYQPKSAEGNQPSVAVSAANSLGEHVFLATLEDGTRAVYKIDADGGLIPVLKGDFAVQPTSITAALSPLSFVSGSQPCINSRGQIAISVRRAGGPDMIVLMTPTGG
jgi:hypothetical protein